jgi:hypothetical protein
MTTAPVSECLGRGNFVGQWRLRQSEEAHRRDFAPDSVEHVHEKIKPFHRGRPTDVTDDEVIRTETERCSARQAFFRRATEEPLNAT